MIDIWLNWKPNLKFGSPSGTELGTELAIQFRVVQVRTEVQDQTFPPLIRPRLYSFGQVMFLKQNILSAIKVMKGRVSKNDNEEPEGK